MSAKIKFVALHYKLDYKMYLYLSYTRLDWSEGGYLTLAVKSSGCYCLTLKPALCSVLLHILSAYYLLCSTTSRFSILLTLQLILYLSYKLTNSMAYGTRRFNAAFTRALQ